MDEVIIPEDQTLAQMIYRVDDDHLYSLDFVTFDQWRDRLGRSDQGHEFEHFMNFNGGRIVGIYGTIDPHGYINSMGFYVLGGVESYGNNAGNPFYWNDENVGQLVKVTGRIGDSSIHGIQLHFADGTDSPMIGEDDGTESTIEFDENDPLAYIVFKTSANNLHNL